MVIQPGTVENRVEFPPALQAPAEALFVADVTAPQTSVGDVAGSDESDDGE